MSNEKKIRITVDSESNSDEDQLDISKETTDDEQDEWVESLDDENEAADEQQQTEVLEEAEDSADSAESSDDTSTPPAEVTSEVNSEIASKIPDESIDKAVDEIVAQEADKLMAAEDTALARQFAPPAEKQPVKGRLKRAFVAWWQNTRLRNVTLLVLFFSTVIALMVPVSRYALLNSVGVRVSASMAVVDAESGRPLKNILVSLQGKEQRTNDEGQISFSDLKLGSSLLKVDRKGFAVLEKNLTLGWGTNPLGEQPLVVTGARFKFVLKDWQSGLVIKESEATSGEYVGQADEEGTVELVIGEVADDAEIVLSAKGYREETRKISEINDELLAVSMVPSKNHAFVSNRDGEYDLYTIDVDGQNEKLLLQGTGKEREVPYVLPHQNREVIAYVSSRDGDTNSGGFILDGLFIIDTLSSETYKVTRSEQLQLVGWSGTKLIYVAIVEGVSAGNSQRSKIISYDLDTKERTDLASSNYFNDVKLIDDTVYYAISSYAVPRAQAKLFSIRPDGSNKQTVVDEQVWSIARVDYETLLYSTESNGWYEQKAKTQPKKLDSQPPQQDSRIYTVNSDATRAVWVDVRDGKGVLLSLDVASKEEKTIKTASGLTDPLYWVGESQIVYRIATSQETADYIVNVDGGEAKKIADVVGNRSRYFN